MIEYIYIRITIKQFALDDHIFIIY